MSIKSRRALAIAGVVIFISGLAACDGSGSPKTAGTASTAPVVVISSATTSRSPSTATTTKTPSPSAATTTPTRSPNATPETSTTTESTYLRPIGSKGLPVKRVTSGPYGPDYFLCVGDYANVEVNRGAKMLHGAKITAKTDDDDVVITIDGRRSAVAGAALIIQIVTGSESQPQSVYKFTKLPKHVYDEARLHTSSYTDGDITGVMVCD